MLKGSPLGCLFCRQHKLEEALLFSGQFMDALQALVDWLYKVEPQLAEDQPVHGDLDLVMNLMDAHKVRAPLPQEPEPRHRAVDKGGGKTEKNQKNFPIMARREEPDLAELVLWPCRCSRRSWGSAREPCRC